MYILLKSKIINLINLITNLLFLTLNFFLIFINLLKILRAELIVIQNQRIGFGNIFTSIDLSRKIYKKKKILFVLFFDRTRFHNKFIYEIFNEKKIILYSSFYIKLINKRFGEYDNYSTVISKKNKFQNIIINFINFVSFQKPKIININQLYTISLNKFEKKNKIKIFQKSNKWLDSYFYLVKKNKIKINHKNKKIKNFLRHSSTKSVCVYIRKKTFVNNTTKNYSLYKTIIDLLYRKGFNIYLTGEFNEFLEKYSSYSNKVSTPVTNNKFDNNKNLLMQVTSKYFVGPSGGGAWFAMYKIKSVIFGQEECYERPNVKNFKYELYFKNKLINRKSKFYKNLKKKMIIDDNMGHPAYLKKVGIKIKNVNDKVIVNYINKNFL